MNPSIASLHKVLKDETRRKIILLLQENGSLSYVDLMKALGITNTGKMNYHLKILGDLLSKREDGQYTLTEKGTLASRLLEFPEGIENQLRPSPKEPQVLWWGIIIYIFTIIGLFVLLRYMFAQFANAYVGINIIELGLSYVPFIFVIVTFLTIGTYMIISDVRKNAKISHKPSGLTKRKAVVVAFLIILGIALIGLAYSPMESDWRLTQIGYENNTSGLRSYTIFLQQGLVCQVALTVSATEVGQTYNISAKHVEGDRSLFREAGPIQGKIVRTMFPVEVTGHYEFDWNGLNVTQVTAYSVDMVSPLIPKYLFSASGVFVLIAGGLSLLRFKHDELFCGRKTGLFWWGLIVFGLGLSWLFARLWWGVVSAVGSHSSLFPLGSSTDIAEILASLAFLFIGFNMMRRGTKKDSETYGLATELKTPILKFDLSQRNYRGLVYLLASIMINGWAFAVGGGISSIFVVPVNFVGFMLLLLFFGIPRPYGAWFGPTSILPFALLVLGLFVEIFVVCELSIYLEKLAQKLRNRTKKPESPNSAA